MNNDISRDIAKYINHNTAPAAKTAKAAPKTPIGEECSKETYDAAQNYLNALGRTKVSMDKRSMDARIASSLEVLKNDPQYVESHLDFCDGLQERGYGLEDAIIGTDIIFKALKKEETYKS